MIHTFKNNSYHVLGLETSASEKEVLKRSKEIINHLRVDNVPDYNMDIDVFENFRTEDSVKDALQRLQAPKKRIKEYFFWFQITDGIDEHSLELFKKKDYLEAIQNWEIVSQDQSTKSFFYKKNLAILYCLMLSIDDNKQYLKKSLSLWKELIDSDKFWNSFSKVYRLHDEQTASDDIISDFRKNVVGYLSDIYTEFHHLHNESEYLSEFKKFFSAKGEKIEKSILGPAYQSINHAVEDLENMKVSEDDQFDKEESEKIKKLVVIIQQELNKMIDLGLYDDSQTKIMRDRAANALRTIVLDLHNNLSELHKSEGLLEAAIKLAGTESLKNKLEAELDQIQKNLKDDSENSVIIEIPGTFRSSTVLFKNTHVEHGKKKIFFKDVVSYSFDSTATSHSIYGVPTGTSYVYNWSLISDKENISISLTSNKEESNAKEDWSKLVSLSAGIIEPFIVKKAVERIFDQGETVKFGDIEFSKKGYSKMKFKFFKEDEKITVYWSDTIYIPKLYQGQVILWEEKNGESVQFASIPMSTPNAVVLPALVQACYNRFEE
jgi:hypothetical protein